MSNPPSAIARETYRVKAFNYAFASNNKIHESETAAKLGFKGGLVPGVSLFAYMSSAVTKTWGKGWIDHGGMWGMACPEGDA